MAEKIYKSFKDFYPFYLTQHQDPICRGLHFVGTGILLFILVYSIATQQWWMLWLLPVVGYGFAWIGHFIFEKNRPATFTYPFYSLASDFVMFFHIITFQLPSKMKEARTIIYGKSN